MAAAGGGGIKEKKREGGLVSTVLVNWDLGRAPPGCVLKRVKPELPHVVFAVIECGDVAVEIAVVAKNDHLLVMRAILIQVLG